MARSREADRRDSSKENILELAMNVQKAQELRSAELERAPRTYEKALQGNVHQAAEFLRMVQKGDAVYDRAMRRAHDRYRTARSGEGQELGRGD
jgi:hypothetical protein